MDVMKTYRYGDAVQWNTGSSEGSVQCQSMKMWMEWGRWKWNHTIVNDSAVTACTSAQTHSAWMNRVLSTQTHSVARNKQHSSDWCALTAPGKLIKQVRQEQLKKKKRERCDCSQGGLAWPRLAQMEKSPWGRRREEEGKGPSGNASFYIFFQVRGFHLIGGEIQVYSEEQTADFNHANEWFWNKKAQ